MFSINLFNKIRGKDVREVDKNRNAKSVCKIYENKIENTVT